MPVLGRRLLVALAINSATYAIDPDALLREALAAEARFDSRAALELFQRAAAARPADAFIEQKLARQYSDLAADAADPA